MALITMRLMHQTNLEGSEKWQPFCAIIVTLSVTMMNTYRAQSAKKYFAIIATTQTKVMAVTVTTNLEGSEK